jgi:DNA helicase II / ATP-dependent DNA helicase PcrA
MPRTRSFKLPGIQDLSKQQDLALALPLDGQHLIIGGPGTGKSVVALLRARRLAQENKAYRFLVYNHVLRQSNQYLFGDGTILVSKTWLSWFFSLYRELFDDDVPKLSGGGFKPIDWSSVDAAIHALEADHGPEDLPCLVIDEGQDMPPMFYKALIDLGFENFYVVADQNQQIHPDQCSSRQDIENALDLDAASTLELLDNYRNTTAVATLARAFYVGDPASPPPALPAAKSSAFSPQLVTYGGASGATFESIVKRILIMSDNQPKMLIGIITPDDTIREKFVSGLKSANVTLNLPPRIDTYSSKEKNQLDFGKGGVMVVNAQSCKGLEFDTVFLADIDSHKPKDVHTLKSRFYVMVARARERVILLRTGQVCPLVDGLLPEDAAILSRS